MPERLLDEVEGALYQNVHWKPQAYVEDGLAEQLVPIEKFAQWWGLPIELRNATKGDVAVDEDRIRSLYADDVQLHQRSVTEFERDMAAIDELFGRQLCRSIH